VESQPGQGTTFTVYLPAADNFDTPQSANLSLTALPGGKETILLVEDEDIVRRLIAKVLQDAGYTVLEAANGEQALSLIKNKNASVHLLLTDMIMPKMNGRELAKKFRLLYPQSRIIYMSGYVEDENIRAEIAQGCAFLQKPVSHTVILHKIRKVLDASKD
jgi:CheY-like chemotaxis protein